MTARRDLKNIIRDRQLKTGESYSAARAHVMRERAALLGEDVPTASKREPVEAVVLRLNAQSARVRILGEQLTTTLRSKDLHRIVPGHVVTLVVDRRWTFAGHAYATATIERARIDVARLGLEPLPLRGGECDDLRAQTEPYTAPDPYAARWEQLTSAPRPCFTFDPIAWGALPGLELDENPTCDAAELAEAGDFGGANEILMETLCTDLRVIDAHAHLGNLAFSAIPARALLHYEVGLRVGELSLPSDFGGVLPWGRIYNRPYLRCLHGYGLSLWRLGRFADAEQTFERMLVLNPNDNQGARFCLEDVRGGRTWDSTQPN